MHDQPQTFRAIPRGTGPNQAWTHMTIPFNVAEVWGSKARVPVTGTVNGVPFRTSIMPRGDGTHYMALTRAMQAQAGCRPGDTVEVVMHIDRAERIVEVPEALQAALSAAPDAQAIFDALSYSHRKEYVTWIESARKEETRLARAAKAVDMIRDRKRLT